MNSYEIIIHHVEDWIGRATRDRPEKPHGLSTTLQHDITAALKEAEQGDSVSIMHPKGAGPALYSGYDITPSHPQERPVGDGRSNLIGWTDPFIRSCIRDRFADVRGPSRRAAREARAALSPKEPRRVNDEY